MYGDRRHQPDDGEHGDDPGDLDEPAVEGLVLPLFACRSARPAQLAVADGLEDRLADRGEGFWVLTSEVTRSGVLAAGGTRLSLSRPTRPLRLGGNAVCLGSRTTGGVRGWVRRVGIQPERARMAAKHPHGEQHAERQVSHHLSRRLAGDAQPE